MEEVTKCSYINCRDLQGKEQILHELPVSDIGLCVKWLINSGHEYLIGRDFTTLRSMKFFVCRNHFKSDSYLAKGTLKENAVPQPYWYNNTIRRTNDASYNEHELRPGMEQSIARNYACRARNIFQFKEQAGSPRNSTFHEEGWCRTCAMKKNNVVNMTLKKKNTEMSLLSKLKLLIEIDDEDTLPLNMCYDCVKKLEQSFQFFQQIYIADNTLRHIFPKDQMDNNDCYGITIDRVDGCISDIEFDPIIPSNEDDRSSLNHGNNSITKPKLSDRRNTEKSVIKKVPTKEQKNTTSTEDKYGTVFSLLIDTCHSDEELHWTDVLNAIERQKVTCSQGQVPKHRTKMRCEFCSWKFTLRRQLKSHLLNHHPKLIKNMCMDCVTNFDSELLFLEHRAVEHNEEEWYRCDHCQKVFSRKKGLRLHITRSHTRRKCYSCDLCKRQFISKQSLSQHIESGHLRCNAKEKAALEKEMKEASMVTFAANEDQSNNLKTPKEEQIETNALMESKDLNHMKSPSTRGPDNGIQPMQVETDVRSAIEELMES
ncbi:hypothetical protein KPH14_005708 [Odynerus spinipes]|uniref:Uncharacterized protein n=1 Tax=Odynerus spinipes TaxID=1348599 RepID=A0AAD9RC65_9HYME|nr:hypothetical protein KPH14_005708 [Odynerus spinipes]